MRKVNNKVRSALLQTVKPYPKHHHHYDRMNEEEEKTEMLQESRRVESEKVQYTSLSTTERRTALLQDVEELKKKLWYEENVHRILERALSTPPAAPSRLPPYISSNTLELLEEVANLEEEVVKLEEQVLHFRQEIHQEAILLLSSKKSMEKSSNDAEQQSSQDSISRRVSLAQLLSDSDQDEPSPDPTGNDNKPQKKANDGLHGSSNSCKKSKQKKTPRTKSSKFREKHIDAQMECREAEREKLHERSSSTTDSIPIGECRSPNKISENTLKCLLGIFTRMNSSEKTGTDSELVPSASGFLKTFDGKETGDPYVICLDCRKRDIGRYKRFLSVDQKSINPSFESNSSSLLHKLKIFLRKLAFSELRGLAHQQKLAFWINIYNSCMMNAFLENGTSASSQTVVELMHKATINVGGHLLKAMTIEHFVLRLPQRSNDACPGNFKGENMSIQSILGLDQPEPLVTFALSCGSWSSPAVRVYTASHVEKELETAKRDYLQAAVGITLTNKLVIPKLLDWYSLDFAKDVESLADWICSQLPTKLRSDASKCIEKARKESNLSQVIQVSPYDFSFRYILAK